MRNLILGAFLAAAAATMISHLRPPQIINPPPAPPVPSPLATWPWPQAAQDTPHPGVTHWLDRSSPDGTVLDFFDFDLRANPHLRFEIYDQDQDDASHLTIWPTAGRMGLGGRPSI